MAHLLLAAAGVVSGAEWDVQSRARARRLEDAACGAGGGYDLCA
jgi:hypothetical protein